MFVCNNKNHLLLLNIRNYLKNNCYRTNFIHKKSTGTEWNVD